MTTDEGRQSTGMLLGGSGMMIKLQSCQWNQWKRRQYIIFQGTVLIIVLDKSWTSLMLTKTVQF